MRLNCPAQAARWRVRSRSAHPRNPQSSFLAPMVALPKLTDQPSYDPALRELWLGDQLVKRFRVPAANQELVLKVFEEEGWPRRIDDTLPPHGIDSHERLHDTIKSLNKSQINRLIKFSGDGKGQGIIWSLIPPK